MSDISLTFSYVHVSGPNVTNIGNYKYYFDTDTWRLISSESLTIRKYEKHPNGGRSVNQDGEPLKWPLIKDIHDDHSKHNSFYPT